MLDKTFDAAGVEPRIAAKWDKANAFAAGAGAREGAEPYCIVIPPPNVTGSLHMGHALNNTLQDILIRHQRMLGNNVLWQPGMDHAGIATQMVVERQLADSGENMTRRQMGRDKFVERVWQWKEESGGQILNQLKRLGASCDWSRERFTMDEGLSEAVLEVFVRLYREGLIYRGKRLVNWDPKFETAISDLEVENIEVDGHMWHFKYPLAGGATYDYVEKDADGNVTLRETRDYISIATTRPETMLGDGAVAVHPDDARYAPIVGKLCEIPVGPKEHRRLIPIITDDYPDPDFGSGAVKITGAHDFNDYEVAKRGSIPMYRLMDTKAAMRDDGLSYEEAALVATELAATDQLGEHVFDRAKYDVLSKHGLLPDPYSTDVSAFEFAIDLINLVPDDLRGLDRFEARTRVVEQITGEGLAVMTTDEEGNAIPFVEAKRIMQPFGDRSHVVIEPMLTDQWFVDAKTLAEPAIASVREGRTQFVPRNWEKTYFEWMENIQPWCVSRQLWWGHRIPAWYGPQLVPLEGLRYAETQAVGANTVFVGRNDEEVRREAFEYYSEIVADPSDIVFVESSNEALALLSEDGPTKIPLYRDPDVLDTWFSSALWPFSTLGWPENTEALDTWYPTSVLVTGFDIIFFWVARMMMMGLHFMTDDEGRGIEPFHTVYVHALVRDKHGAKMSKSKGNVIDPLELIDQYGADALRFTLASMATPGRDVKLDPDRIAGYRAFGNKLWNATRFAQMNGVAPAPDFDPNGAELTINRWILTELSATVDAVDRAIAGYRFDEAAMAVYRFVWNTYCDWYLELLKPVFAGQHEAARAESRACAAHVLDAILKLMHPFMPFLTEELWALTGDRDGLLCHARWPGPELADRAAAAEINWLIELVSGIRSVRSEMHVPPSAKAPLVVVGAGDETCGRLLRHDPAIKQLARVTDIVIESQVPKGAAQIVVGEATVCLPLGELIDVAAERARLEKAIGKAREEIARAEKKLGNDKFVANARAEVVQAERDKLAEMQPSLERLQAALARIESL
ncbi:MULTISPECIES: valine--tRNA ligase [unclassified Roseitalea]|uniref:valine--tRNA ligase n=1 Tax=unclassified Roseitalea TaxID=2639107 RepID=UPI00273E5634|nr:MULTISPECIES: valine--tRNA ligase [unclassified Roseitalea]